MIVERFLNKVALCCCILLLNTPLSIAQDIYAGFSLEVDTFFSTVIELQLPFGCKKQTFYYDEGKFVDYIYQDGSLITVFKGALHTTPLLSTDEGYVTQSIDTLNHKIIVKGIVGDRVWREDTFEGLIIHYDNVPIEKKTFFDKSLDSIRFYSWGPF